MALIYAMLLGADCIDDCEVLRAGRTRRLLGGWLPAPSTLGTFLRAFTFGHVRQLDRLLAETLTRAWRAGAGPGDERLVVDVDSFIGEVHGYQEAGRRVRVHQEARVSPAAGQPRWTPARCCTSACGRARRTSSRGVLRFAEELIARVARAGASGEKLLRADSAFWNNEADEAPASRPAGSTRSASACRRASAEQIARDPRGRLAARSRTTPTTGRHRSPRRPTAASG